MKETVDGHKCRGVVVCFEVSCECGWISFSHSKNSSNNPRAQAYAEWREHVRSHTEQAQRNRAHNAHQHQKEQTK